MVANHALNLLNTRSVLVKNKLFYIEEVSLNLTKVSHPAVPKLSKIEKLGSLFDAFEDRLDKIRGFSLTMIDD